MARDGRMRTQTTTFCLDSEDDAGSAGLDGEAAGVAEGVASSSATTVNLDSRSAAEDSANSLGVLSDDMLDDAAKVEVEADADADAVEADFVKGEDLAAEPTLAFLAIAAAVELRCSEAECERVVRRLAKVDEGCALMVAVALEVRGVERRVDLRGEMVARGRLLPGDEMRTGLAAVFVGSLSQAGAKVEGSAVRPGSEGREEIEVAGDRTEESEDEVEAEE